VSFPLTLGQPGDRIQLAPPLSRRRAGLEDRSARPLHRPRALPDREVRRILIARRRLRGLDGQTPLSVLVNKVEENDP